MCLHSSDPDSISISSDNSIMLQATKFSNQPMAQAWGGMLSMKGKGDTGPTELRSHGTACRRMEPLLPKGWRKEHSLYTRPASVLLLCFLMPLSWGLLRGIWLDWEGTEANSWAVSEVHLTDIFRVLICDGSVALWLLGFTSVITKSKIRAVLWD